MATVKSIVQLRGKIGDNVFRRINGKNIMSMMTGPTAEQVLTAPEFANTRKTIAEFGQCCSYGGDIIKGITDTRSVFLSSGKIRRQLVNQRMMQITKSASGEWGQRTINGSAELESIILEKKGTFNFDFMNVSILGWTHSVGNYMRVLVNINPVSDLITHMPDQSGNWSIKTSIHLIIPSRRIYDDITGSYIKYRTADITRYMSAIPEFKYYNGNIPINTNLLSGINVDFTPPLDEYDTLILLQQYSLYKLMNEQTVYVPTGNYITRIYKIHYIEP